MSVFFDEVEWFTRIAVNQKEKAVPNKNVGPIYITNKSKRCNDINRPMKQLKSYNKSKYK